MDLSQQADTGTATRNITGDAPLLMGSKQTRKRKLLKPPVMKSQWEDSEQMEEPGVLIWSHMEFINTIRCFNGTTDWISFNALSSSLNLGRAFLQLHFPLGEKEMFVATDSSSVKISLQVGCDRSAQSVPYGVVMGQKSLASSWLRSTWWHRLCAAFLQPSSPLAKLAKFSIFLSICLTSSLPWRIPWFSQGKLVIISLQDP